jgi:hypothetical protein
MKIFDHFPSDDHCFLCGNYKDAPCILVPIDGTGDGRIMEGLPIHVDCLLNGMSINKGLGIVYKRGNIGSMRPYSVAS